MTDASVTITIAEYDGPRTLSWGRADRHNDADRGQWTGDQGWIDRTHMILVLREPVVVLMPNVTHEFGPLDGTLPVQDVAAAMIAAVAGRGDCEEAFAELPSELLDDKDIDDDAVF